jgi:hypothetical protein
MEKPKKRTISFTVMDFEYEDIFFCARITGHGGKSPTSSFGHYSILKEVKRIKSSDEGQSRKPGEGCVYIIQSEIGGYVKIGFSVSAQAKERIKQVQQGLPFRVKVIKILDNCTYETEKNLHKKYQKYRIRGEWFNESILPELIKDLGVETLCK